MLMAGVEFSCLATSELMAPLRIRKDHAILSYHAVLFPAPKVQAAEGGSKQAQLPEAVAKLPVLHRAMLWAEQRCGSCPSGRLLGRRSSSWAVAQATHLARFPQLPPDVPV